VSAPPVYADDFPARATTLSAYAIAVRHTNPGTTE
jgi:hypothetical protein